VASGRVKGFWRRVRKAHLFVQGNPSYADPSMDTPERAAEKRQDSARSRPGYPGDKVPSGVWSGQRAVLTR
jgi:hypothetical protein